MTVYLIGLIVTLSIVAFLIYKAPRGYEDETGFHYGDKENKG